jgi:hypothetical protein
MAKICIAEEVLANKETFNDYKLDILKKNGEVEVKWCEMSDCELDPGDRVL